MMDEVAAYDYSFLVPRFVWLKLYWNLLRSTRRYL